MPVTTLWFLVAFALLIPLERWIHQRLQGLWLLLFNSDDVATILYSLVLLPGVFLHEGSHWLMATLLGVRIRHFSVTPQRLEDGTLRLGYIEVQKVDFVRESLIGIAPLLAGSAAVIWMGSAHLNVTAVGSALARGQAWEALLALRKMLAAQDVWPWLYLLFAVSNSMLPSASDRRAWPSVLALLAVMGGLLAFVGFGPALVQVLAAPAEAAVRALALAFTVTAALDVCLLPVLALVEWVLIRLTRRRVEYS